MCTATCRPAGPWGAGVAAGGGGSKAAPPPSAGGRERGLSISLQAACGHSHQQHTHMPLRARRPLRRLARRRLRPPPLRPPRLPALLPLPSSPPCSGTSTTFGWTTTQAGTRRWLPRRRGQRAQWCPCLFLILRATPPWCCRRAAPKVRGAGQEVGRRHGARNAPMEACTLTAATVKPALPPTWSLPACALTSPQRCAVRWPRSTARCASAAAPWCCALAPGRSSCRRWHKSWGRAAWWRSRRWRQVRRGARLKAA